MPKENGSFGMAAALDEVLVGTKGSDEKETTMTRYLKFAMLALLALVCIVPVASARPRVFVGGYFGPGYYGPAWYGPSWYGPGWYGAYGPYGYVPNTGSVKFETKMKDASVYVDGGYAGTVGELKTFHLRPGDHNLELRSRDGQAIYQERVNVIAGKTLKIAA
jgi:hypothetical protein